MSDVFCVGRAATVEKKVTQKGKVFFCETRDG